jgi:hypothetical protein
LNDYRTQKKDPSKTTWLQLRETEAYQEGRQERYKIERKFGEAKQQHGLARCRYLGLLRYAIQSFLTAMALNLKRLVLLLTGVPFKGRAKALAQAQGGSAPDEQGGTLRAISWQQTGPTHSCGSP